MSELIRTARAFALQAHAGQKYGDLDYAFHLAEVVGYVRQAVPDDCSAIAAAWLHDVLEDTTAITYEQMASMFNLAVANTVDRVTDVKAPTRRERKALTYPRIAGIHSIVIVKAADRLANTEASEGDRLAMYLSEYPEFRRALYIEDRGPIASLFRQLDNIYWRSLE